MNSILLYSIFIILFAILFHYMYMYIVEERGYDPCRGVVLMNYLLLFVAVLGLFCASRYSVGDRCVVFYAVLFILCVYILEHDYNKFYQ